MSQGLAGEILARKPKRRIDWVQKKLREESHEPGTHRDALYEVLTRKEGRAFALDVSGGDVSRIYGAVLAAIDLFTARQQRVLRAETYWLRRVHLEEEREQQARRGRGSGDDRQLPSQSAPKEDAAAREEQQHRPRTEAPSTAAAAKEVQQQHVHRADGTLAAAASASAPTDGEQATPAGPSRQNATATASRPRTGSEGTSETGRSACVENGAVAGVAFHSGGAEVLIGRSGEPSPLGEAPGHQGGGRRGDDASAHQGGAEASRTRKKQPSLLPDDRRVGGDGLPHGDGGLALAVGAKPRGGHDGEAPAGGRDDAPEPRVAAQVRSGRSKQPSPLGGATELPCAEGHGGRAKAPIGDVLPPRGSSPAGDDHGLAPRARLDPSGRRRSDEGSDTGANHVKDTLPHSDSLRLEVSGRERSHESVALGDAAEARSKRGGKSLHSEDARDGVRRPRHGKAPAPRSGAEPRRVGGVQTREVSSLRVRRHRRSETSLALEKLGSGSGLRGGSRRRKARGSEGQRPEGVVPIKEIDATSISAGARGQRSEAQRSVEGARPKHAASPAKRA
eukprot:CAMPEP_0117477654 /NCGR_PEP_ID=MMETSP0784-20121206/10935_1 /TAXON_ID=39447 /ORGANISM="" /LENGTH=562 /DNA_ID=CAMNT_0005271965 /DNA_START=1 /DNA_END=1686 /DNA_ORIENTATION=-